MYYKYTVYTGSWKQKRRTHGVSQRDGHRKWGNTRQICLWYNHRIRVVLLISHVSDLIGRVWVTKTSHPLTFRAETHFFISWSKSKKHQINKQRLQIFADLFSHSPTTTTAAEEHEYVPGSIRGFLPCKVYQRTKQTIDRCVARHVNSHMWCGRSCWVNAQES